MKCSRSYEIIIQIKYVLCFILYQIIIDVIFKTSPSNIGIATSLYNTITVICDVKIIYKTIRHATAKSIEKINHDAMP